MPSLNIPSETLTRRSALKFAAAGAVLTGAGTVSAQEPAKGGAMSAWYDVTQFGAKPDGNTPCDDAINRALDAAYKTSGGVIWFPPGKYLIESKILVRKQVTLLGAGWNSSDQSQGTWICAKKTGANIEIRGKGTLVQGIAFFQEQPEPHDNSWQPADHSFAIHAAADDIFLKQINLFNCTNGIGIFNEGTIGRVILDHIWGRPLRCGIRVDNAQDVIKINNVHFWPFWEGRSSVVEKWMLQNGVGIQCLRTDNPQFSNIFLYNYNRAFSFASSVHGITSKFAITNADCDYCVTALEIAGNNATGTITNFNAQGPPGDLGISILSPGVKLLASNVRLTLYQGNAIRATGNNTRVFVNNLWAELWNQSKNGFPGVEATDGAAIYLGRPAFFDRGNGAPNWRRDGINGGKVLTEFDELVSQQ